MSRPQAENKNRTKSHGFGSVLVWVVLVVVLVGSAVFSLFVGRYGVEPLSTIEAVLGRAENEIVSNVILSIRLPRILLTLMVGASLALSGASFQGVFQNPLVSPDVLSVSSGAAFGAVLGIMLGLSSTMMTVLAMAMGLVSVFVTYLFSKVHGRTTVLSLVLSGMVASAFFNALVSLMKYVADTDTQLPAITYWLLGSFATTTFTQVKILVIPFVIGTALLLVMANKINILSLGDEEAYALGVNPTRSRLLIIFGATLITAASITVTGIIGWVGLVIPHIARFLVGPNHAKLLPASALIGAAFMTLVDLAARTLLSSEIPVGILTAMIGAPFFAVLFRYEGGRSR